MEASGEVHILADLPPSEIPSYKLYTRLCKHQMRSGRCGVLKKSLAHVGDRSPSVEPLACRYGPFLPYVKLILNVF